MRVVLKMQKEKEMSSDFFLSAPFENLKIKIKFCSD